MEEENRSSLRCLSAGLNSITHVQYSAWGLAHAKCPTRARSQHFSLLMGRACSIEISSTVLLLLTFFLSVSQPLIASLDHILYNCSQGPLLTLVMVYLSWWGLGRSLQCGILQREEREAGVREEGEVWRVIHFWFPPFLRPSASPCPPHNHSHGLPANPAL